MSDFELPRDAKQQSKKPVPQKDSPSLNKADLGVEENQEVTKRVQVNRGYNRKSTKSSVLSN